MSVAESDPDLGPSARFNMEVLWRPDSKAFALTATLWKRGSNVEVYVRNGSAFRHIELPELADIPDKIKRGKSFPHVSELNARSAKRWQKDGSLVVEIETIEDGNEEGLSVTAKSHGGAGVRSIWQGQGPEIDNKIRGREAVR